MVPRSKKLAQLSSDNAWRDAWLARYASCRAAVNRVDGHAASPP
jgi:hypothetical protein